MTITANVYLEFIENHLPSLKAGTYRFSGTQTLNGPAIGENGAGLTVALAPQAPFQVRVEGERFSINPSEIVSIFPPKDSLGHYANVLPHIAFKRNTLPWERMIASSGDLKRLEKAPWMALLVLNQDELLVPPEFSALSNDEEPQQDQPTTPQRDTSPKPPNTVEEYQQAEMGCVLSVRETLAGADWLPTERPEPIKIIYVKKEILEALLSDDEGLTLLAHARKSRIRLWSENCEERKSIEGKTIEVWNEEGALIHQEIAQDDDLSINCGPLEAGTYKIKVKGSDFETDLTLKPSDQIGGETALVVANRLPKPGCKSIIHLVSLEGRYKKKEGGNNFEFDFDGQEGAIPLVSLHSWSFTALTEKETFTHILLQLNHQFLFGIDGEQVTLQLDHPLSDEDKAHNITALKPHFLDSRYPLSGQAKIIDYAVKELTDKDHHHFHYFIGQSGAVYNGAGHQIATGNDQIPESEKDVLLLIPDQPIDKDNAEYFDCPAQHLWIEDGNKHYFISEDPNTKRLMVYSLLTSGSPTLRLPSREGESEQVKEANHFLQQGYVPLPHHFRRGGKSVSWYRSPLLPGKPDKRISYEQFPLVETADQLLRYDATYGMFDTSYAAAWELGRLLCLRNKRVSLSLYRWKRTHVRLIKTMEQQHLHPHLPFQTNSADKIVLPDPIEKWFSELSLLGGLPFSYLIPDERMLPPESLRFFYLDPSWVAALIDGALSIGRVDSDYDRVVEKQALMDSATINNNDIVSGFLLRSSVVKGWPDLQVNAYVLPEANDETEDATNDNINHEEGQCLRLAHLSDNLLLGLFKGDVTMLDIHEKPETVHFGFQPTPPASKSLVLIDAHGQKSTVPIKSEGNFKYYNEDHRIIEPTSLKQALAAGKGINPQGNEFSSAQFALSLIEGVSRVRFIK